MLLVERGEIGAGLKLLGTAFTHVPQNASRRYPVTSGVRFSMSVAELIALQKSQNAVRLTFRKQQSKRQSSIDVASNAPPKSSVSSSQNEVVPHNINIRSLPLQPGKFVIDETKRLLQHYLPRADAGVTAVRPGAAEQQTYRNGFEIDAHLSVRSPLWLNDRTSEACCSFAS